jgi:hypothetical protein
MKTTNPIAMADATIETVVTAVFNGLRDLIVVTKRNYHKEFSSRTDSLDGNCVTYHFVKKPKVATNDA